MIARAIALAAAQNYRSLRVIDVTVRKTDLLITKFCIVGTIYFLTLTGILILSNAFSV